MAKTVDQFSTVEDFRQKYNELAIDVAILKKKLPYMLIWQLEKDQKALEKTLSIQCMNVQERHQYKKKK